MRTTIRLGLLTVLFACLSCSQATKRNPDARPGGKRDPLLMSHLTHGKNDPLYASSEQDDNDEDAIQPASVSNKLEDHASDRHYRTLVGRLEFRTGAFPGWHLRYLRSPDTDCFGGVLRLQSSSSLALFREGDLVKVKGQVKSHDANDHRYHVEAITLVNPPQE